MDKETFENAWYLDRKIEDAKKDLEVLESISKFCNETFEKATNKDSFFGFENAFNHAVSMLKGDWCSALQGINKHDYYKHLFITFATAIAQAEKDAKFNLASLEGEFEKL